VVSTTYDLVSFPSSEQIAELTEPLEPAADSVAKAFNAVPQPVRDVLDGVWLGAPLHPALTDVPLGAWSAAAAPPTRRTSAAGSRSASVSASTTPRSTIRTTATPR
jgi:hypothetical protein